MTPRLESQGDYRVVESMVVAGFMQNNEILKGLFIKLGNLCVFSKHVVFVHVLTFKNGHSKYC